MRLIDADAIQIPSTYVDLFENCRNCKLLDRDQVREIIDNTPTIEPKRGEWVDNGDRYFRCSLCGTKDTDKWHWCHGCGADMREREGE